MQKIEDGLRNVLRQAATTEGARLRARIKESFGRLRTQIGSRIDAEIASIDATLQTILIKKQDREYSVEQEQAFLQSLHTDLTKAVHEARKLLD